MHARKRFFILFVTAILLLPHSALAFDEKKVMDFAISYDRPIAVDNILSTAFKRMGYDFTITATNTENAILLANSGENDGCGAQIYGIDEEYKNLVIVPVEIAQATFYAYAKKGSGIKISSWEDLEGFRVAHLYQKKYTTENIPQNTAPTVKKTSVNELIKGLVQDEYDIAVATNFLHIDDYKYENIDNIGTIDIQPMYPYLNSVHKAIVPELTKVLEDIIKESGTQKKSNLAPPPETNSKTNILHISSYSDDMKWANTLNMGLTAMFSDNIDISVHFVGLNSDKLRSYSARAKAVLTPIRTDILASPPDIIIVSDNNALNFVFEYYYILFKDIPVIFCDLNSIDFDAINSIDKHITGVLMEISASETVGQMLELFPDTKNIFVINDYLETGQRWRKDIENQLSDIGLNLNIQYNENEDIDKLIETVKNLPENTLILSGFYSVDNHGRYFSSPEFQNLLYSKSSVPIFGLASTSIGNGQLGGKYTNPYIQGALAGEIALKLLDGEKIEDIPVKVYTEFLNEWIFDANIMEKWDIKESDLPKDAIIINKKPTLYELNPRMYVIVASVLLSALIIMIVLAMFMNILRKQNKKLLETQKNLHTAEELLSRDTMIKEIKNRLEKTIDSAPLYYIMTVNGVIVEANEYSKVNLGIKLGKRIEDYPFVIENIEPYDEFKTLLETNAQIIKAELVNGEIHRFYVNVALVEHEKTEATVYWGIDIEQTERQKDTVKRSEEDLKRVIDGLPMPMLIADLRQKEIVYVNHSFTDLFEFDTLDDAIGFGFVKLYPEKQPNGTLSADVIEENTQKLLSGGSLYREIQYVSKKQNPVDIAVFATSIRYDSRQCAIYMYQDIREEKKRIQMLLNAAETQKEANKLKSRFLVNMSHEIRTPMNAIIGLSKLALMREQAKENFDTFEKINLSAQNLLSIINDILDFSKIEAEKLDLVEDDFCLEDVISNAFMISSEKIGIKKVEMLLDMHSDVPYYLRGDKTRLWQVLKNILDNSAKYTEKGRIILTVSVVKKDGKTVYIKFEVKDTGLGMSDEQMEKLFLPFEQFHNHDKYRTTGTGLGMAITEQLIKLMSGQISVNSKVNIGTTTDIIIPFKKTTVAATVKEAIEHKELLGKRILAVDDEHFSREIIKELLISTDALPVCVKTGNEAVEKILEHDKKNEPFDIIIVDYLLENETGIELANKIKDLIKDKSKLLMVSAYSKQLLESDIKEAGFEDIIEKPFVPSTFIRKLCNTVVSGENKYENKYPDFSGARVMVCEDNLINQEVAVGMLNEFGIIPATADNGEEALALLEKSDFDLIFMDIIMPVVDGHEATRRIRTGEKSYKDIPIIAMTANVMQDEIDKCTESGMNGHIGKPLEFNKLQEYLSKYFPSAVSKSDGDDYNLQDIEGVDIAKGISRFGGNKKKYAQALINFANEPLDEMLSLSKNFDVSDINKYKQMIHTLKGVTGNLGFTEIYETLKEFEQTLDMDSPNLILFNAVIEARKQLSKRISDAIKHA